METEMQYTSYYRSPLGDMLMAADEIGLTGLWFEGQKYFARQLEDGPKERELPIFEKVRQWLDLYFLGKERMLRSRSILSARPFRKRYGKSSVPFHTDRR